MRSGKLRHRVDIQRKVVGRAPQTGDMLENNWLTVWRKCPAAVEPLSARDFISANAGQSEATGRIVIRYRVGVLPTMRIVHRGEIYNIVGQPLPDKVSGMEYLTILVSAGVNNG